MIDAYFRLDQMLDSEPGKLELEELVGEKNRCVGGGAPAPRRVQGARFAVLGLRLGPAGAAGLLHR